MCHIAQVMEPPQTIVDEEPVRRQASEQDEEEDGYVRVSNTYSKVLKM